MPLPPSGGGVSRRRFLQSSLADGAVAASAFAMGDIAHAQNSSSASAAVPVEPPAGTLPFLHGVASGDPLPNSVVLWTRVTPSVNAVPGSGLGSATTVGWEVALDAEFRDVVKQGEAVTSADRDHTVHVDPWDLAADTVYFYHFTVVDGEFAGHVSPTGRTKTAPDFDASPEQLNLAVASCANWESGFFSAYTDIANRAQAGDLDLLVFLGDYIYEYATGEAAGPRGPFRIHEPAWETITLQDYRMRHGRYRTDPELQAAHAALPWCV